MFSKDSANQTDTIISSSVKVEGDLVSGGDIIIDGQVVGTVTTQGNLVVGEKAEITADIKAANAQVSGLIKGNLEVAGKLELTPTSKINGDVLAKILVVSEGAQLNGRCQMGFEEKTDKVEVTTTKNSKKIVVE